ncbi:MAG: hypothetical protein ACI867_001745 [Glaciecola sp.]|jgi:hypothetical protein
MHPQWDELAAFARHETVCDRPHGWLRPRLLLYNDQEATIYVRARDPRPGSDPQDDMQAVLFEMAAVSVYTKPTKAAVLLQCRLGADDATIRPALDPTAQDGVMIQRAWCEPDGSLRTDLQVSVLTRDDDGTREFEPFEASEGGPLWELLGRIIGDDAPLLAEVPDMGISAMVYALTKFGHVIAVKDRWRLPLGLDEPVSPKHVRPADRLRAQRLARRHRDQQRRDLPELESAP